MTAGGNHNTRQAAPPPPGEPGGEECRAPRVLHIDTGREMRGGQWQVLRLIEGLRGLGVECLLLAPVDGPLAGRARALCPVRAPHPWNVWSLARRCHLVHAHDARAHTLGLAVPRPLVVSRRVAFPVRSPWKYARAAHYVAVSRFVQGVLEAGGVPAAKISVVHDGVPLLPATSGGTAVLAPDTRADLRKGAALAEAAARLAGVPIEFSSSLERDLARAAVLLYITYSEGLGSGALLAMSAGVPVIASRVGGLEEAVRHEETGLLVENTPESIAAALRRLRGDAALARRLGARARQSVEERFSTDGMVRRTLEVYRQVLT